MRVVSFASSRFLPTFNFSLLYPITFDFRLLISHVQTGHITDNIFIFVFMPPIVVRTPGVVLTSPDIELPMDVELDDYYPSIPWDLGPFARLYTCVGSPSRKIKCGDYIISTTSIRRD